LRIVEFLGIIQAENWRGGRGKEKNTQSRKKSKEKEKMLQTALKGKGRKVFKFRVTVNLGGDGLLS